MWRSLVSFTFLSWRLEFFGFFSGECFLFSCYLSRFSPLHLLFLALNITKIEKILICVHMFMFFFLFFLCLFACVPFQYSMCDSQFALTILIVKPGLLLVSLYSSPKLTEKKKWFDVSFKKSKQK